MEIIPIYEVFNPITALNTIEEFIKNSGLFPFFLYSLVKIPSYVSV